LREREREREREGEEKRGVSFCSFSLLLLAEVVERKRGGGGGSIEGDRDLSLIISQPTLPR
jgi:hypothetical protein